MVLCFSLPDENGAVVMLMVNGQSFAGRLSGKCDFILIAKRENILELQVRNTATPCHLRMSLTSSGSTIFSDRTGNAKLTITPPDDLDTVKVEISYSMCNQNNYIPCGSCMAFTSKLIYVFCVFLFRCLICVVCTYGTVKSLVKVWLYKVVSSSYWSWERKGSQVWL